MRSIRMHGKKGYFFVVDVFIAIFILSIGIMVILAAFISEPDRSQTSFTSRSLTIFMSNMTMARYDSDFKFNTLMRYDATDDSKWPGSTWTEDETNFIRFFSNSLFEQIAEFYFREHKYGHYDLITEPDGLPRTTADVPESRLSWRLTEDVVRQIVPPQFEVQIIIRDPDEYNVDNADIVYTRNEYPVYDRDESPLLIPSKTIVMGTFDDTLTGSPIIWGPYIIEVHIWQ